MEIRIGLADTPQGLELDLGEEADAQALKDELEKSMGGTGVVWLSDKDGNEYAVSAAKIAFVKIGAGSAERRIGFGV